MEKLTRKERRRQDRAIEDSKVLMGQLLKELEVVVERFGEDDEMTLEAFKHLENRWRAFCKKVKSNEYSVFGTEALKFLKRKANEESKPTEGTGEVDGEPVDKEDQPTEGSGPEAPVEDHQTGVV